jgi:hypothetical protein
VSYKTRLEAKLNRERREREREKAARFAADPVFAELDASLAAIGWPRKQHVFGTRGPRSDADGVLTDIRDLHVARLVLSARAAGWSYRAALALGAEALRRSGIGGASSPKTVDAILARRRRVLDAPLLTSEAVDEEARRYGLNTTKSGSTSKRQL